MQNINKLTVSILAAALMLVAGSAQAEGSKIGVIRFNELVSGSPQFKAGQTKMKAEFEKRKNDLEAEGKKLGEDVEKFKREQELVSADARAKAEKDLKQRSLDFDYKRRQFGEDFQKRDSELSSAMMSTIKEVVIAVAKEKGLDIVLQDPVYALPSADITGDVLKRLQSAPATGK
jgi:outer membrane protein